MPAQMASATCRGARTSWSPYNNKVGTSTWAKTSVTTDAHTTAGKQECHKNPTNPRSDGRVRTRFERHMAANAVSDVYAMGARPLFALGMTAFPREKLGTGLLEKIVSGGAAFVTPVTADSSARALRHPW